MPHLMIKLQHYLNASSKLSDSHLQPIVRIQKDILKFQIAVNDLFAVDVVHLKRPKKILVPGSKPHGGGKSG